MSESQEYFWSEYEESLEENFNYDANEKVVGNSVNKCVIIGDFF